MDEDLTAGQLVLSSSTFQTGALLGWAAAVISEVGLCIVCSAETVLLVDAGVSWVGSVGTITHWEG
jgi:hypothetical protein